jgi:DNA-binding protein H-NS
MSHNADEIVEKGIHGTGSMTRLEAAEQNRRQAVREEMQRHAAAVDAELTRHHRAMDAITIEFGQKMGVA